MNKKLRAFTLSLVLLSSTFAMGATQIASAKSLPTTNKVAVVTTITAPQTNSPMISPCSADGDLW